MKYFFIAGEASGDLHASNLAKAILQNDPEAEFAFIGGDRLREVTAQEPFQHFSSMNYMGIADVIRHMGRLGRILAKTRTYIRVFKPDALILIDYAGFNMRIARKIFGTGSKVFYYITPKVWAWKKYRVRALKKYVDRLFVIFPFEFDFFKARGMDVEYHGNPLMDEIAAFRQKKKPDSVFRQQHALDEKIPVIALLPGSRRQEIEACLPEMLRASMDFPDHKFVIAGAPSVDDNIYKNILAGQDMELVRDQTYDLLAVAHAAIVTSGTATLETALLNVPQVVVYKMGKWTYRIGKLFVTFKFFSLVNLIYGSEVVKELLQDKLAVRIAEELKCILEDSVYRQKMLEGYEVIRNMLGLPGVSERVAGKMIEVLRK